MRSELIEFQGNIDKSTIIFGEFSIPLPVIDRSSKQKVSKGVAEINSTINQLFLIDIYRVPYPTASE